MSHLQPVEQPTPRQEAADALKELRTALNVHGITFPSLDLDAVTLAAIDHGAIDRRPLIELGRVNLETARKLARALGSRSAE